jgi:hypothetical protein
MVTACGDTNYLSGLAEELDIALGRKQEFSQEKDRRIAALQGLFDISGITLEQEYDLNQKLYEEYRKYRLDSAMNYVERNLEIAKTLGSSDKIYLAQIQLAPLYSFSGMYIESLAILKSIKAAQLPEELRGKYYEAYIQFYDHYGTASYQNKYGKHKAALRDSLLAVAEPESRTWKSNYVSTLLDTGDPQKLDEAEAVLLALLSQTPRDTPDYASSAHQLARVYGRQHDWVKEKADYTISAITDIKCATKEHSALQNLALVYFDEGDEKRAFNYTQEAIEDAIFSGAQFRATQISKFYSLINASYRDKEAASKVKLQRYLILVSVLTFSLVLLLVLVYGQIKKLSRIRVELSAMNSRLTELNGEMVEKNNLLSESNTVKVQYIAQFFDLCSEYIDKIEEYRKSLNKLASNHKLEELFRKLKSTQLVEDELDELYRHFDRVFLGLYPNFVSDFNSLLDPEERIQPKAEDRLNRELRIYALLRLGITDSAGIAAFLRCSLSTVYNYRTKARNKAAGSREDFEKVVMKIGLIHETDDKP